MGFNLSKGPPLRVEFEIQSDFQYLPFLTRLFKGLKVPDAPRLTQILVEAYNNAVIHGHKGKREKWVGIGIDWKRHRTRITIMDEGKGLSQEARSRRHEARTSWETRGRGIELIYALAKKVSSQKKNGKHFFTAVV